LAHQSYAEEQTKISKEAAFAALGRAIADRSRQGANLDVLMQDAAVRRQMEQEGGARGAQFAALVRQIGDAVNAGKPTEAYIDQLMELRRAELR
jgi:hypothetical protein